MVHCFLFLFLLLLLFFSTYFFKSANYFFLFSPRVALLKYSSVPKLFLLLTDEHNFNWNFWGKHTPNERREAPQPKTPAHHLYHIFIYTLIVFYSCVYILYIFLYMVIRKLSLHSYSQPNSNY